MPKGLRSLANQPWPDQGWQYDEVSLPYAGSWVEALDELGRAGWRVVAILHDEDAEGRDTQARVILERPRGKQWRTPKDEPVLERDVKPDNVPDEDGPDD